MDVQRTIEFILQMQAKAEVRMAKTGMDRFEKTQVAIQKVLLTGTKLLVKMQKDQGESRKDWDRRMKDSDRMMKELAEAQKKTDRELDRLIDSWARRPANGHQR
jgi:hypothetical protein